MKLIEVIPPDVHGRWEWVRKGLEEVRANSPPEACPWLPEDVYCSLMERKAVLFLIRDAQESDVGFLVLQALRSSFEQVLFVWVIWAEKYSLLRHSHNVMSELRALARSLGLKRIRHVSTQEGWASTKLFVPVSTIYECEVSK